MQKIGIIGNGYVGGATALLKSSRVSTILYDIDSEKCSPRGIGIEDLLDCNFIFVCVPTPMNKVGGCATHMVEGVVDDLSKKGYDTERVIVKSTVPVGTSRRLGVMFMPEFLTEQNWEDDFLNQQNWILGTNGRNDKVRDEVYQLFESAWNHGGLNHRPHMTFSTTEEAELTKYTRNCFLATKVSFFNEVEEFCRKKDINYRKVRELTIMDKRIGSSHTAVPGPDGKRGYGGTCFPKDMASFHHQMHVENDLPSAVIGGALRRNKLHDRPERDWEEKKGRAVIE
jgi:UDPglucose 6-dehydrogenase